MLCRSTTVVPVVLACSQVAGSVTQDMTKLITRAAHHYQRNACIGVGGAPGQALGVRSPEVLAPCLAVQAGGAGGAGGSLDREREVRLVLAVNKADLLPAAATAVRLEVRGVPSCSGVDASIDRVEGVRACVTGPSFTAAKDQKSAPAFLCKRCGACPSTKTLGRGPVWSAAKRWPVPQ